MSNSLNFYLSPTGMLFCEWNTKSYTHALVSNSCHLPAPGEVMAVIKLDHQQVVQTAWKPHSQQCWDHRASIDLDRVRTPLVVTF